EALETRYKVLKIRKMLIEAEPSNQFRQVNLAVTYMQIGDSLRDLDPPRPAEALELYQKSAPIWEGLVKSYSDNADYKRRSAINHQRVGMTFDELDRQKEARESFNLCVSTLEDLVATDSGDSQWQ